MSIVRVMPENAPIDLQFLLARIEKLEAELAAAKAELARKDQIIAALQKRLFGSSSERIDPGQLQLDLDGVTLGKSEPPPETPGGGESEPEAEDDGASPKRNRRKKADLFPKNLMVVIDSVIVPEEVAADPEAFIEIGEEYHDELEAIRAALYWRRQVRKKFVSKKDRERPPLMSPAPLPSIPGTLCGPALMAQILVDKYQDHLPHNRQSNRLRRQHGVHLSRQTLNGWTHAAADYLRPIGQAIKTELLASDVLQADETPMDYLSPGHGKVRQGYLWTYRDLERGTVYFDWQLGRGHTCLIELLGLNEANGTAPFPRIIQCDGYSAYQALADRFRGIRLGGCLAHIRRRFYEAREQVPEVVMPILQNIRELYRIERWLRHTKAPPECRRLVRKANSRPLADELRRKIEAEQARHLPQSKLGEAVRYAVGQWSEFIVYLEEGRLEIDNNLIENVIRPAKLGLKNYLFIGNAEAGASTALIYTLLANCAVHDLDPEIYLAEVIRRLSPTSTPEQIAELTPAKLSLSLATDRAEAAA